MNIAHWGAQSLRSLPSLPTLSVPSAKTSDAKLMAVSKRFEGIFIGQLFKEMKKSVDQLNKGNTLFKTSMAENIFKDMLFDQYADNSAQDSPLGLAKMVYDSLNQKKGGVQ